MQPLASQGSSRAANSSRHTVPLRAIESVSCPPLLDATLGTSLKTERGAKLEKLFKLNRKIKTSNFIMKHPKKELLSFHLCLNARKKWRLKTRVLNKDSTENTPIIFKSAYLKF